MDQMTQDADRDAGADQSQGGDSDQDAGGLRLFIDVSQSGEFEVGSMPIPANDDGSEGDVKPASSIGDALKLLLSDYREKAPSDSGAQQQFQAGYAKAGQ